VEEATLPTVNSVGLGGSLIFCIVVRNLKPYGRTLKLCILVFKYVVVKVNVSVIQAVVSRKNILCC
jgi:hypothetical protein